MPVGRFAARLDAALLTVANFILRKILKSRHFRWPLIARSRQQATRTAHFKNSTTSEHDAAASKTAPRARFGERHRAAAAAAACGSLPGSLPHSRAGQSYRRRRRRRRQAGRCGRLARRPTPSTRSCRPSWALRTARGGWQRGAACTSEEREGVSGTEKHKSFSCGTVAAATGGGAAVQAAPREQRALRPARAAGRAGRGHARGGTVGDPPSYTGGEHGWRSRADIVTHPR